MKTIKKYVLKPEQSTMMLSGSSILSVENRNDNIVIYVLVDSEDMQEMPYEFRVYNTDQEIDVEIGSYTFLGTVEIHGGSKAFHVFYKGLSSMDL